MMNGLDNSYLINRDCNLTDNAGNCIGDGQRDITIPVIKQRWDARATAASPRDSAGASPPTGCA